MNPITGFTPYSSSTSIGGPGTGMNQQTQGSWSPQMLAAGQQGQYNFTPAGGHISGPSQSALDAQNLAQIPVQAQMSRFNAILPLLSGAFGNISGNPYTIGGSNTAPPPISAGPVLNPQQIQQQVNTSRAANDQSTASQIANQNAGLAGRGFGSNSPLSAALANAAQGQNMATNTANETNLRLNAAQQNAGQLLNSQQALSNQWATQNQLAIQRAAPYFQERTALIQALGGLV